MAARRHVALAVGLVAFAVYFRTLAPGVTTEDSGELVSAAATLGIAHPPGFPAWTLLVHLFTRLPGAAAFWANLSSAVFAALAVGFTFATARALGAGTIAAASGALLFAFGETCWSQAVITEVYALNAAVLALVLYALVSAAEARRGGDARAVDRWLRVAAAGAGLGVAGHYPLTLLVAPAWAGYFVATQGRDGLRRVPRLLPFLLAPLVLYAYLPWAAAQAPLASWGEPSTWPAFWDHVLRRAYRPLELSEVVSFADKRAFLAHAAQLMVEETRWVAPPLALLGALALGSRRRRAELALLAGVIALDVPVLIAILHFRFDHENLMRVNEYYIPAWCALALLAALGLSAIEARLAAWGARPAAALLLLAPLVPLLAHWAANDRAKDTLARDYNLALLTSLEPNAIYFPSGDYAAFPALYLQAVEHVRPDVLLADYTGKLSPGARRLAHTLDARVPVDDDGRVQALFAERSGRPVYFAAKSDLRAPLALEPWGLVYRVRGTGVRPPPDVTSRPAVTAPEGLVVDDLGRSLLADACLMRGEALADLGRTGDALAAWREAERWSEASKEGLNNLGSTLAERGLEDEAVRVLRRAAGLAPDYQTPRRNLAVIFERRVRAYEQATRERPDHAPTWNNLGSARAEAGDGRGAAAAFQRALELDPAYALACRNLAAVEAELLGDPAAAARVRARCP